MWVLFWVKTVRRWQKWLLARKEEGLKRIAGQTYGKIRSVLGFKQGRLGIVPTWLKIINLDVNHQSKRKISTNIKQYKFCPRAIFRDTVSGYSFWWPACSYICACRPQKGEICNKTHLLYCDLIMRLSLIICELGQNFFISWFTGFFFSDLGLGGGGQGKKLWKWPVDWSFSDLFF